jgi:hypothetical protein
LRQVRIRGYVTNVISPTNFEIEDYRIYSNQGAEFDFANASPELNFHPEDIRVGVELEVRGLFDDETGHLTAKSIKVDMEQFKKMKQTAILSAPPAGIQKTPDGNWFGTFSVDGQKVRVLPRTQIVFKITNPEKKALKEQAKNQESKKEDDEEEGEFKPLNSLDEVSTGYIMTYEGARSKEDGVVIAEKVEFSRHFQEKGELDLQKSVETTVKPFDVSQFKPGELKINQVGKYPLTPSPELQEYVTALGEKLIPAYQKQLSYDDPVKIKFRFFVVNDKEPNAFALPNGVVVIQSGLFNATENESQFASVIGHEIAHATQEHSWRQRQYHKKKLFALQLGAAFAAGAGYYDIANLANAIVATARNGFSREMENQADRLGLEEIIQAGYDPREAVRFWKVMAQNYGDRAETLFDTHHNHTTRRSFLMNELKNNYADLDYSSLIKDDENFKRMKLLANQISDKKRKIVVN